MLQESMLILYLSPENYPEEFTCHLILSPVSMPWAQKPANPKHLLLLDGI